MLPIEKLRAVRTIISHGPGCADGLGSALLINDALPDREIRFMQYSTSEFAALEPSPGMLFVDFTPVQWNDRMSEEQRSQARGRAQAFVDAGAIVLDHHGTQREVVEMFGELGVFADEHEEPGVSGAVLAFREVWRLLASDVGIETTGALWKTAERFAWLAGVRDTWQVRDPLWAEACAQSEALLFWPFDRWSSADPLEWPGLCEIGPVLLQQNAERDARTIAEAYRFTTLKGTRIVTFQGVHTSDVAEALGAEADLVVGWHYRVDGGTQKVTLSCRSRGSFDVAAMAKHFGGGGHAKAAGFTLPVDRPLDPYSLVRFVVEQFEAGQ